MGAENSEDAIPATIAHISTAGSVLRIELQHQLSNQLLHVELPRSQERFLHLTT